MRHDYRIYFVTQLLVAFCAFTNTVFFAQNISMTPIGMARVNMADQPNQSDPDFASMNWVEVLEKRSEFTATYQTTDGYVYVDHSEKPINRLVNGAWQKIDPSMQQNGTTGWYAPNQDYPVFLNNDASFSLSLNSTDTWVFGALSSCNGSSSSYSLTFNENNDFVFSNSGELTHNKEILAFENGVKYNYTFDALPSGFSADLIFTERILLNEKYKLTKLTEIRETFWGEIAVTYLLIQDMQGEILGRIDPAYAVDGNQNSHPVFYDLVALGNGVYDLNIRLDESWLTNPERVFPILVDPLVVGPLTQWAGGQMPSCIFPQQNIDSILVTIPAGITPISLAVGSSFYADPFTAATMSMGSMQFSTTCAATQTYEVQGNTGTLPGTAYLDSANMLSPLTCCFPKSCSQQQFYLRKHLARTGPGTGCNAMFIRYDPITTQWPFRARVYGRTPESYISQWSVPQTPRCSDNCEFNATAYVRYGVPPYTFTHPWQDTIIVEGNPSGCNTGQTNVQFQLTVPDCPSYCDPNFTSLPVPNPTVIDACGVSITDFPFRNLNFKPAPQIIPLVDTVFCAGELIDLDVANCLGLPDISWSAGDFSGTTNINIQTDAGLQVTFVYNVLIQSTVDGCEAEPLFQPIYVLPLPNISFEVTSENTFLGDLIDFQNTSTGVSLVNNEWLWQFGDGSSQSNINAQHTYNQIGIFEVCLSLAAGQDCSNEFCQPIPVVPNAIVVPNVFTPNADGNNDVLGLFFDWAQSVELVVVNRWGQIVATLEITNFNQGWNGIDQNSGNPAPDGVYFYDYIITTTLGGILEGHSFAHLLR